MAASLDLSIIIVNWRSADFVQQCVESVYRNTDNVSYEIIVIDNASYDNCGTLLHEHYPAITFLQSPENIGFARANNCAFEAARGSSILFLNPDTRVVETQLSRCTTH